MNLILVVSTFLALFVIAAIGLWLIRPGLLGFKGKTLWDWIGLLLVPGMVGFGTATISFTQYMVEQDRIREEAVQQYFDRMGALLIDRHDEATDERVKAIARAQTLAVLRLVEGERAGRILGFMTDLDMLHRLGLEFEGLNIAGAELKALDLQGIDFEETDLTGADLERSDMAGADLERSVLVDADLKSANLRGASLEGANLSGADLDHTDLRGADLTGVTGLTAKQLDMACLDATTRLPIGMAPPLPTRGCTGEAED